MYKVKALVKKTMGLLLATLVAFGVTAGTTQAFAGSRAATVKPGELKKNDKNAKQLGSQLTTNSSEPQSRYEYTEVYMHEPYMKDAELHVYSVKDDKGSPAADIAITYKNAVGVDPQLTGVREYTATAKKDWVFKNWTYGQFLNGNDRGNYHALFYSFSEDHNNKSIPYTSGNVISVNRTGTIGESALIKRIYKVYANLNPTIMATAGVGGSITPDGKTEVTYGENQKYNFTANKGYIIASLKIDGVEQTVEHTASGSYEFKAVKSPHTIEVSFAKVYTVTYIDGVAGEEIFQDQVTSGILSGADTPKFNGTPSREGYKFTGWAPTVADKVTANVTYVAQWKDDKNNNGTPDDQEDHFTVTYTDGVEGEEIFQDQVHQNILVNMPTPAFEGTAPSRTDYVFTGWTPTVANKVTRDVTYVAQWKRIQRTVTFKDGDKTQTVKVETGKAIDTDALTDQSMPQNPTNTGYTFKEWNTKNDGKGETFTGASVVNGDMTVYAIYTQDTETKDPKAKDPKTPQPRTPAPTPKPTSTPPAPAPQPKPAPAPKPKTPSSTPPQPTTLQPPETPAPKPTQPPTPGPDPKGNGNNNGSESVAPDSTDIPELNIGGGNSGNGGNTNGSGDGSGVGGNANNGANNGTANGTSNGASVNANGSSNGVANRSGSAKSQATDARSADALPNTGSNASGITFAFFGAIVFGMFAASGAAANCKRAKHLR